MKQTKKQKAEYLFDEIGNVSDAFLGEALTYRAKKKGQVNLKWPISVAAALLVLVVALPILWSSIRPDDAGMEPGGDQKPPIGDGNITNGANGNMQKPPSGDENDPNDNTTVEGPAKPLTLETLLSTARQDAYGTVLPDEIQYFNGSYLLWQIEGDETLYRSRYLTKWELQRIITLIREGTPIGNSTTESTLSLVYLVVGNGDVLTPYLPATEGNIGASVLFDYTAELIPSQSLISFLSDILN